MSGVTEKPWGYIVHTAEGDVPVIKNRRLYVVDADFSLSPDTLVGSAFHLLVDREMIWQGVIVGEPQAGRYLCEIEKLGPDGENVQRVFSLDTLMGLGDEGRRLVEGAMAQTSAPVVDPSLEWRLYDSIEQAQAAFANFTAPARENA